MPSCSRLIVVVVLGLLLGLGLRLLGLDVPVRNHLTGYAAAGPGQPLLLHQLAHDGLHRFRRLQEA